jgi:hypothetical protein
MHKIKRNIEDLKYHLFCDKVYPPSRIVELWNIAFPLEVVCLNSRRILEKMDREVLVNTLANGIYSLKHKYVWKTTNNSLVSFSDPTRLDVDRFTEFVFDNPNDFHIQLV